MLGVPLLSAQADAVGAVGINVQCKRHAVLPQRGGKIERALQVSAHYFTESAREKITGAGGAAEVITQ